MLGTSGVPPTVMTVEMINPDGKRYNFEQIVLYANQNITITNQGGNSIILRFWENRQSEKNFPVDIGERDRYESHTLPNFNKASFKGLIEYLKWMYNHL
jgi:hypothetical protein